MKLNAVYTGNETDLMGLHAKVEICGGVHPCGIPDCDKLYAQFDDPELPAELSHLASSPQVFYVSDFAIEDPESPLAPQNAT